MTSTGVTVAQWISDSQIVPDGDQGTLIQIRDGIRDAYFGIGDIANRLVEQSALQGLPVTQDRVFKAVGNFCGKSGRTVRYYAETAAHYDADVRREFDVLPFSFFVFARYEGDNWRAILEHAMTKPEMSLDALKFWWMSQQSEPYVLSQDVDVRPLAGEEAVESPEAHDDEPLYIAVSARSLALLYDVVDRAEFVVRSLPIPAPLGERLMRHIDGIRELLPELVKAVKDSN